MSKYRINPEVDRVHLEFKSMDKELKGLTVNSESEWVNSGG